MAFWTDNTTYEPLRQHRWYISFADVDEDNNHIENFRFALKDCKKPSFRIETTQHLLINHTYNFPKTLVWQPIDFSFVSARANFSPSNKNTSNDLAYVLMNRMRRSGYKYPFSEPQRLPNGEFDSNIINTMMNGETISKFILDNFFESFTIYQVDSNGQTIEAWELYGILVTGIDYGTLSYQSEELVDIKVSISYDYAVLLPQGAQSEYKTKIAETKRTGSKKITIGKPGFAGVDETYNIDSSRKAVPPYPPKKNRLDQSAIVSPPSGFGKK